MRTQKKKGVKMSCHTAGNLGRDPTAQDILMVMISFGEKISGGGIATVRPDPGGPIPHRFYKT